MESIFLEKIRIKELDNTLPLMPGKGRLLELGAGVGWQAKRLEQAGYDVDALELEGDREAQALYPIVYYDGVTIPFEDNRFDIIFSSNVLEHIPHLETYQEEMRRVLKPDGIAVHLLPSGSWRLWSTLTHYMFAVKYVAQMVLRKLKLMPAKSTEAYMDDIDNRVSQMSKLDLLKKFLIPSRRGERGNVWSETYYFSRFFWNPWFKQHGWEVQRYSNNKLFYTSYAVFDSLLPVSVRGVLSKLMGASCHVYILTSGKKAEG